MISDNLGIYNSYKRAKAMEEVRTTPFSVEAQPQVQQPQGRTFTPEDHQRYEELRRSLSNNQTKPTQDANK